MLGLRRLRFRAPRDFNDPCDGQVDPLFRLSTSEGRAHREDVLRSILTGKRPLHARASEGARKHFSETISKLSKLPTERRESGIEQEVARLLEVTDPTAIGQKIVDNINNDNKMLCLSESPDSMLMWSHYALAHQGVVLGFDSKQLRESMDAALWQVEYADCAPEIVDWERFNEELVQQIQHVPPAQDKARKLLLTKSVHWQYEREWRATISPRRSSAQGYVDVEYSPNALTEIICGVRTNPQEFTTWEAVAKQGNPGVLVRAARLDIPQFHISIHELNPGNSRG